MQPPIRSTEDGFHLFHREKRHLRGTLVLLSTLLTLALVALSLPRIEVALDWASGLVDAVLT
ncbi:MAG: hypothetical protein R3298_10350 [Gammaproteobacteria bacterium]|nr:hypothetical protein [Gammaproteobacteria bacterium]